MVLYLFMGRRMASLPERHVFDRAAIDRSTRTIALSPPLVMGA